MSTVTAFSIWALVPVEVVPRAVLSSPNSMVQPTKPENFSITLPDALPHGAELNGLASNSCVVDHNTSHNPDHFSSIFRTSFTSSIGQPSKFQPFSRAETPFSFSCVSYVNNFVPELFEPVPETAASFAPAETDSPVAEFRLEVPDDAPPSIKSL